MAKVIEMPVKCRNGHEIKSPNRIIEMAPGVKECLICLEESNHKEIMKYLQTGYGAAFFCNTGPEGGFCEMVIPGRDYLKLYSTEELLEEIKIRVSKNS